MDFLCIYACVCLHACIIETGYPYVALASLGLPEILLLLEAFQVVGLKVCITMTNSNLFMRAIRATEEFPV